MNHRSTIIGSPNLNLDKNPSHLGFEFLASVQETKTPKAHDLSIQSPSFTMKETGRKIGEIGRLYLSEREISTAEQITARERVSQY